jgi:Flp pilus assembly protein TadD
LLLAGLVLAVEWPVLACQADMLDDDTFVQHNPLVRNPEAASVGRFFTELRPSTVKGYYIPLTMTSLMIDYALGGRPGHLQAFHATNLALHVGFALGLALLLHLLAVEAWPAVIVAALVALHPLCVEPLAWISERKTLLASFFGVASLAAYAAYARAGGRPRWRWLALLLYVLSVLSKPTTTPLPLLLIVLDYWPLRRLGVAALRDKIPFLLVMAVAMVVAYQSHAATAGFMHSGAAVDAPAPLLVLHNLGFYFEKIAAPRGLSPVYLLPQPFSLANPAVVGRVALVAAVAAAAAYLAWRGRRALPAGAAFFAAAIFPTLGLVHYSWVVLSDKYTHFPMIGLALPLAAVAARAWGASPAHRRALVAAALLSGGVLAGLTRAQLAHWSDTLTLDRRMVAVSPESPNANSALGLILGERGELAEALRRQRRAVELAPTDPDMRLNLGSTLQRAGELEQAAQEYRALVAANPDNARAHTNLGSVFYARGEFAAAIHEFREALRVEPEQLQATINLGFAYEHSGQVEAAIAQYRRALQINPEHRRAREKLATLGAAPR